MSTQSRILIVEDEALVAADIEQRLQKLGYEVAAVVDTGEEAVALAADSGPDLALMDIRLKGRMSGIEAAGILRDRHRIPVIYLTAHADPDTLKRAGSSEPFGYIVKPFQEHDLHATIEMAFCRARAEERVRRMERWLTVTLNSIGDGVVTCDLTGRVTYLNRTAEHLTGWTLDEAMGHEAGEVFDVRTASGQAAAMKLVWAAIENGSSQPLSEGIVLHSRHGRSMPIEDRAAPIRDGMGNVAGVVVVFRDRTEHVQMEEQRRRIEQKMRDTQKLESLGVLAGGIAHDFNNLLTGIVGNTSLAMAMLPRDSEIMEFLDGVRLASQRATDLIRQMLAYSGRGHYEIGPINLSALVEETAKLISMSVSKKAELRFSLAQDLPSVAVDAVQIRQVVMNLVINASEALGDRPGIIELSTSELWADPSRFTSAVAGADLLPGTFIMLEVRDSGSGISPADLQRIFDPFYTTKFTGRGLGLAAVIGTVRGHAGALTVESELGKGTVFRIYLRTVAGSHAEEREEPMEMPVQVRRTGTVLVIDDEPLVRQATGRILEALGFQTELASDGPDGLELFRQDSARYSLVLLDLTMPLMDGLEVFVELRRTAPEVKVVLMSGYSGLEAVSEFEQRGLAGFLQKPFDAAELGAVVDKALAREAPGHEPDRPL